MGKASKKNKNNKKKENSETIDKSGKKKEAKKLKEQAKKEKEEVKNEKEKADKQKDLPKKDKKDKKAKKEGKDSTKATPEDKKIETSSKEPGKGKKPKTKNNAKQGKTEPISKEEPPELPTEERIETLNETNLATDCNPEIGNCEGDFGSDIPQLPGEQSDRIDLNKFTIMLSVLLAIVLLVYFAMPFLTAKGLEKNRRKKSNERGSESDENSNGNISELTGSEIEDNPGQKIGTLPSKHKQVTAGRPKPEEEKKSAESKSQPQPGASFKKEEVKKANFELSVEKPLIEAVGKSESSNDASGSDMLAKSHQKESGAPLVKIDQPNEPSHKQGSDLGNSGDEPRDSAIQRGELTESNLTFGGEKSVNTEYTGTKITSDVHNSQNERKYDAEEAEGELSGGQYDERDYVDAVASKKNEGEGDSHMPNYAATNPVSASLMNAGENSDY